MSSPRMPGLPEWEDDWRPPRWNEESAGPSSHRRPRRVADQAQSQRPARSFTPKPSDRPVELFMLAIAPATTALLAVILWLLSPLPGAGPSPAPIFIIALVQFGAMMALRDDRPDPLSLPWLSHLAATVGLLPLLAIQVSLLREPYVSLGQGSAWPAVIASIVAIGFASVLAVSTAVRFWKQPDQAALVFLPSALLIPAAIGQRAELTIVNALSILGLAMFLGSVATVIAAPMSLGGRLLVPPFALAIEIGFLWAAVSGPVLQPTSGGVVRLLYIALLFTSIILIVLVPILAVWLRRKAALLPPPPAPGVPR